MQNTRNIYKLLYIKTKAGNNLAQFQAIQLAKYLYHIKYFTRWFFLSTVELEHAVIFTKLLPYKHGRKYVAMTRVHPIAKIQKYAYRALNIHTKTQKTSKFFRLLMKTKNTVNLISYKNMQKNKELVQYIQWNW